MARAPKPPAQIEPKPAEVIPLHPTEPEAPASETPAPPFWRWYVPRSPPPFYAHAYLGGAERSACRGHVVAGGVSPPLDGIPRCPVCLASSGPPLAAVAPLRSPDTEDVEAAVEGRAAFDTGAVAAFVDPPEETPHE